ncbi:hypothetical protein BGW38_011003 [Lunasporangiospora selenospora]|uniref:Uncharacterized protein n=1 Tax=Lunasporangiospora selenospora TaxID=979761 RepID=A0A9P6FWC7_9FUNG|nr:hypothetical protein BGW38_011003 [Lunasporangiospora selenospora]
MACTIACAGFFSKALFCQNPNHFDIPTSIPTIGLDPILDTCLCTQGVIPSMHSCATCRANNNITYGDVTWTFINACNRQYPERSLVLPWTGAAGPTGGRPLLIRRHKSSTRTTNPLVRALETVNTVSLLLLVSLAISVCSGLLST